MKFEIKWSRLTLFCVNAFFGLVFLVIRNIEAAIPILKRVGGTRHVTQISFVRQLATYYPAIYVFSIVLSWICFYRNRHKLATFFAFLPALPGGILLYASINFSLLATVYKKMTGEIIKGFFKLPGKILFPWR
jgi:hypothetical protein